jgi:hypothetical protein
MKYLLFLILLATACKKNDTAPVPQTMTEALSNGTWQVQYCFMGGVETTSQYNGYDFTFKTNGEVDVYKSGVLTQGLWSEITGVIKNLNLLFSRGASQELVNLSVLWQQDELTAAKVALRFGIGAQPDRLTFIKR